jgi:tellurite resistance protein TerA
VVTLHPASGPEIEVRLDEPDPTSPTCAIAMLENQGGDLVVRREVRYIRGGQADVDDAYGWGMEWARGRK